MRSIMNELRDKYYVDGETEQYATIYENKQQVLTEIDREIFEEKFDTNLDSVNFPIITFDNANAVDGWIFEAGTEREEIISVADNYFDKK